MDRLLNITLILLLLAPCLYGCVSINLTPAPQSPASNNNMQDAEHNVLIGDSSGRIIKHILGVNIGPIPAGKDPRNADLTQAYKDIGVRLVRTHDFYDALDMAVMYPDRTKDTTDPRSYDFKASDRAWRAITEGGFEPYLRLGDSWNNARPPAGSLERSNWVKAAVEVIRHYREGKWNGFKTDFRFVEIWNEPDMQQFWPRPHTPLEFYQLFDDTSHAIKKAFPQLMVGGPAVTQAGFMIEAGRKWLKDFINSVSQRKVPLDFFSWHMYSNDPGEYARAATYYRSLLDGGGLGRTVMHITEWNTDIHNIPEKSPLALELRTGGRGASILTAAWIELLHNNIEISTFYRGPDPDINAPSFYGMFYADGKPKKTALAFSLWSRMLDYTEELQINSILPQSVSMLAGKNSKGEVALLVANTAEVAVPVSVDITFKGDIKKITRYTVDDSSEKIQINTTASLVIELRPYSVSLLIFE